MTAPVRTGRAGSPARPAATAPVRTGSAARLRSHLSEPLFRNAYALVLSTGLCGAFGFLYWLVAARRYSEASVGQNVALVSAMMTLSQFAQLDLAALLMRFLPRWRAGSARRVALAYGVSSATALVLSAGFVLAAPRLGGGFAFLDRPALQVGFCLAVVVWGIFTIQDGVLVGLQRAPVVPVENTAYAVAKIVLLVALAGVLPRWGVFVSWTVPVAVALVPINLLIFGRYLPHHRGRPLAEAAPLGGRSFRRYLALDYLSSLSGGLSTVTLPILVVALLGAEANAHFYVAFTLVLILDTVAQSLGSSLMVEGSYEPARAVEYARRAGRRGLTLLLPVVAGVELLAPFVLGLFGGRYSSEASTLLRLLALGILPRAVLNLYVSLARVFGQVGRVLAAVLSAAVLLLVLVVAGARTFGLAGVGAAYVVTYGLVAVAVAVPLHRLLGGRLLWGDPRVAVGRPFRRRREKAPP